MTLRYSPPDQGHGHVANDLKTGCADLVDGVLGGVPGGIIKVHHIDGPDARLLKLQVIVNERVPGRGDEIAAIAQLLGCAPDQLDNLGRADQGVSFLIQLKILVRDQVEEDRIEWLRAGDLMGAVVPRANENIRWGLGEVAVVLSIHEEEIDPGSGRSTLQHICHAQQKGDTGAAVVRAHNCLGRVAGPRTIRIGPAIPMRQQKQPLLRRRIEARDEIPQRKRVSARP